MVKDLEKEIKELNNRINELEKMLSIMMKPLREVSKTTRNYIRLTGLLLDKGGLTPDMLIPEVKDSISREIIRVLLERNDQNISQITNLVRTKRGTASRRIVRDRINELEKMGILCKKQTKTRSVYCLTDKVIDKWSKMLGLDI